MEYLLLILIAAAAHELADDGIQRHIRRVQRRDALHHLYQVGEVVLLHILRRQFLPEIGDVGQALGQDTGLIVVEGVNVNGGVALKGPDIVDLAGVDALGTLDRLPQGVTLLSLLHFVVGFFIYTEI